jgi:hypothetical protein
MAKSLWIQDDQNIMVLNNPRLQDNEVVILGRPKVVVSNGPKATGDSKVVVLDGPKTCMPGWPEGHNLGCPESHNSRMTWRVMNSGNQKNHGSEKRIECAGAYSMGQMVLNQLFNRTLRKIFKVDPGDYMLSICGNDALENYLHLGRVVVSSI